MCCMKKRFLKFTRSVIRFLKIPEQFTLSRKIATQLENEKVPERDERKIIIHNIVPISSQPLRNYINT